MNINRLGANLRGLGRAAVELVYPRNCQFCTSALDESCAGVICPDCLRGVRFIEPPFCERCALPFDGQPAEVYACGHCRDRVFQFRRALAACTAESIVREAIHRFKYQGEMYWAVHLEEWLVGAAWRWIDWDAVDAIVPVPLHPRKHREREFNQAEILARALARASGKPLWRRALRRVRDTETQTHLSARARARNLRNAFAPCAIEGLEGQRVVLVDDVFTTGATLDGCARILKLAGVADVVALTVARGI